VKKVVGVMAYERHRGEALDYKPCRYPGSKLLFRGPRRALDTPYLAFLGGTETYGKFIQIPFPNLLERDLGVPCVNFGWPNAGVDVFLNEPAILKAASRAQAVVLQLPCAQNMTNRFYSVHPRRNDRFLGPSALMKTIFSEVDFTEFHFTRHLLRHVKTVAPDRFSLLRDELQQAWIARMRLLLTQLGSNTVLLWFSGRRPAEDNDSPDLVLDPAFVTRRMIQAIADKSACVVQVCASDAAKAVGSAGMIYSGLEASAAAELLGPMAHEEAARALMPTLSDFLK